MAKYDIYGIGAALVDTEVEVTDAFLDQYQIEKGLMTLVDQSRQAELLKALADKNKILIQKSGGSACNTIVAAANFGANTLFSGKVAYDADGDCFAKDLTDAGVSFYGIRADNTVTGKCLVMVTKDAERTMNTFLGASEEFTNSDIDKSALLNSEWFYIEGYLLTDNDRTAIVKEAVNLAKKNGVKVALSLSDPFVAQLFADNLNAIIGDGIDLIFCNKDEALAFTQSQDINLACEALKGITKTFAITDGANGAMVFDGDAITPVAAVPTKAIDTNGAGDMFAGAVLYGITSGRDYIWSARLGNESAARVVAKFGPRLDKSQLDDTKKKFNIKL